MKRLWLVLVLAACADAVGPSPCSVTTSPVYDMDGNVVTTVVVEVCSETYGPYVVLP